MRSWGQKKRREKKTRGQQYWMTGGQEERRTGGEEDKRTEQYDRRTGGK